MEKQNMIIVTALSMVKDVISYGLTIKELENKYNLSRRTVQKYLNTIFPEYVKSIEDEKEKEIYAHYLEQLDEIKIVNQKRSTIHIEPEELLYMKINNSVTNEILAVIYGVSESTIVNKLNLLSEENKQLLEIQNQKNVDIGRIVGGKSGIYTSRHSEYEMLEIAEQMISNGYTLLEASKVFEIPISTLYEGIKKLEYPEIKLKLDYLFYINCKINQKKYIHKDTTK